MGYSNNSASVAVYPICIEYKIIDDDSAHKGAISFISDDKDYDHQQVKAFARRTFEILRKEIGLEISHW